MQGPLARSLAGLTKSDSAGPLLTYSPGKRKQERMNSADRVKCIKVPIRLIGHQGGRCPITALAGKVLAFTYNSLDSTPSHSLLLFKLAAETKPPKKIMDSK